MTVCSWERSSNAEALESTPFFVRASRPTGSIADEQQVWPAASERPRAER
jgi:hypothetical protein